MYKRQFCTRLERHQSRIHLIAGVSTATAKINVLDCDGFGMKNFFEGRCREGEYKKRDCLYIQTPVGEKIVLISGGGKSGDEKLIKGNTYGMAYVTAVSYTHLGNPVQTLSTGTEMGENFCGNEL